MILATDCDCKIFIIINSRIFSGIENDVIEKTLNFLFKQFMIIVTEIKIRW